jgi:hypothetical protein
MKPETIVDEEMTVSVYDDFAIVAGRENLKGTYKGAGGEFAQRFTNVYVRRMAASNRSLTTPPRCEPRAC